MNMIKAMTLLLGSHYVTGKYLRGLDPDPNLQCEDSSTMAECRVSTASSEFPAVVEAQAITIDENGTITPHSLLPAVAKVTPAQAAHVIKMLNAGRASTTVPAANMRSVTWIPNLADDLYTYFTNNDANWLFKSCNSTAPLWPKGGFCGFDLMQMEPFKSKYPGCNFLIHDTFVDPDRLVPIFWMRTDQQKHCFNYNACSATSLTNFQSCGSPLVLAPEQPCSWSTQYYPRLMLASFNELACVIVKVHGPSAPGPQDWSFFCYGNYTQPLTDQPYEAGPHCSACPEEAPVCVNNLCTPKTQASGLRL